MVHDVTCCLLGTVELHLFVYLRYGLQGLMPLNYFFTMLSFSSSLHELPSVSQALGCLVLMVALLLYITFHPSGWRGVVARIAHISAHLGGNVCDYGVDRRVRCGVSELPGVGCVCALL